MLSLHLIFPIISISEDIFDWPYLKIDNETQIVLIQLMLLLLQAPLLLCVIVLHHCRVFSLQLHVCTSHTCRLIHKMGAWGSPHWLTASSATLHAATSYPMKTYNLFSDSASHLHTVNAQSLLTNTFNTFTHTCRRGGNSRQSACDRLYFQSCDSRRITAVSPPCVRISIS